MNKIFKIRFVFFISVLLVISGCRKFDDILVLIEQGEVGFTLSDADLEGGQKYILYDIAVTNLACDKDCVMWEMVRKPEGAKVVNENILRFPVRYGVILKNMQNNRYKKLTKGYFSVVATIAVIEGGEIATSRMVHKEFEIRE